ncbi:RDD domain containing protein [Alkaliphilus metalliredigens QYMF]|uniref:RDD domain containing protein n=1 Tax=Alkaliphilus metalliredigens (strain QYMF) TaxID=293826 RepID=A6TNT1_ALKMQ|nr:RDD family protein [Alkaliphilus metalliredigens]ABR47849.1 RDD domain containing protein [Alkaliphilus metalliredigens QYMF]
MHISSPLKRFIGNLLDNALFGIIVMFFFMMAAAINSEALVAISFFAAWGIQLYFWSKGTSLGKNVMGMKVVNKYTQEPVGLGLMIIRETIGKFLSGLIFSLGYIWILIDSDHQGWHDKFIQSIVVDW